MGELILVENCLIISVTDFKRAFIRIRKQEEVNDSVNIPYGAKKITINLWSEYRGNELYLAVAIEGLESQEILLSESDLTFGARTYFMCDCGHRSHKLYLPPNSTKFKCRKCHKLAYELTTFNHDTIQGKLFYRTNRMIKLANARAEMKRVFYKGQYTKRFKRHLDLFSRAGFGDVAEDAKKLMKDIYSQKQKF